MADINTIASSAIKSSKDTVSFTSKTVVDEDLNAPYLDKRQIVISLVHNYSNYRKANMKVLGHRTDVIGSSITSCRVLASNKGEIEAYFPGIIGLAANNPEFVTRVKDWLSNIQFAISNDNVILNISFRYNHKKDYYEIAKKENAINAEFESIDRSNLKALREGVKRKVEQLNELESTKYKYGFPENVEQYLMYRHCLLYKDVAKDISLINDNPSIRFYIKDEQREEKRQKHLIAEKTKAMRNFVELAADDIKFNATYIAICIFKNDSLIVGLGKDMSEKQAVVMDFVNTNPDKFNKIINDKHLVLKAFIETLIVRGELIRSDFNQQIATADGTFIGANMTEAIGWFENPKNKDARTAYENKVKLS